MLIETGGQGTRADIPWCSTIRPVQHFLYHLQEYLIALGDSFFISVSTGLEGDAVMFRFSINHFIK